MYSKNEVKSLKSSRIQWAQKDQVCLVAISNVTAKVTGIKINEN